ncbi:MAG: glycosyltransferase, partial [Calditrichia bacterium]
MNNTPIAFFAYNRPEHTKKALESLSQCGGAVESELFIFCDGSKKPEDEENVKAVRILVKSKKWCGKVNIIERDKNRGLANSIISGVTEIVNRYGRIIVLEDDLVLSPEFLNYMNDALEIYENEPRVMHIAGYTPPLKGNLPETLFYRLSTCWGWATWKRAWEKFEPDVNKLLARLKNKKIQSDFNINGSMNFYQTLRDNAKGRLKTWAIHWYASVFLSGGLCLHPGMSMVNNIGHDGTGMHCGKTDVFDVIVERHRITEFTSDISECGDVVNMMTDFY